MQPDHTTTWDDFTARKAVEDAQSIPAARGRQRRPAKASALSALLLEAIQVAGARRGRLSQAERVREQVLLEVLTAAIRRAR